MGKSFIYNIFISDQFLSQEFPGEFTIESDILGQGAFGSVHLVKDIQQPEAKRFVAKKMFVKDTSNLVSRDKLYLYKIV